MRDGGDMAGFARGEDQDGAQICGDGIRDDFCIFNSMC